MRHLIIFLALIALPVFGEGVRSYGQFGPGSTPKIRSLGVNPGTINIRPSRDGSRGYTATDSLGNTSTITPNSYGGTDIRNYGTSGFVQDTQTCVSDGFGGVNCY